MSMYLFTPEALRAEHEYRTERLRRSVRRLARGTAAPAPAIEPALRSGVRPPSAGAGAEEVVRRPEPVGCGQAVA